MPREATFGVDLMTGAGAERLPSVHPITGYAGEYAANVWRAMFDAAPKPGEK